MLVNCDKCGQEYDVTETRLPPQGARIKCPSCGNIFLVRPEHSPVSSVSPIIPDLVESSPNIPTMNKEETGWKASHLGLTYSFPDLTALRNWLSARSSLNDVKVAKGNDEWKELGDYPEVLTTELITKFFPLGDVPTSRTRSTSGTLSPTSMPTVPMADAVLGPMPGLGTVSQSSMDLSQPVQSKNSRQIKIEREKAQKQKQENQQKVIIFAIVGLIVVIAAVFAITYSVTGHFPFMAQKPEEVLPPEPNPAPTAPTPVIVEHPKDNAEEQGLSAEEREELRDQARVDMLREEQALLDKHLNEARAMINDKKWPEAQATLEALNQKRPNHLETLQLLAKAYRGLGLNDKVAETEAEVRRILAEEKKQEDAAEGMVFGEK